MYNTLMSHTHFLRGLALATLLIPSLAFADYLTPEQVLNSDQNAGFFDPPPSPRDAQAVQARQQASVASRRAAEQSSYFAQFSSASAASSVDDSGLHGAAPTSEPSAVSGQDSSLSLQDQRILERVKQQQAQAALDAEVAARMQVLASQQSLHSGAPLSSSGPGTILSAFLLAGAGLWTVWKAKKMEKAQ